MSLKFKSHCNVMVYLETADPELFQLIEGLCLVGMMNSKKRSPGLTFLRPTSKDVREQLIALATSDDPAKVEEARKILASHLLRHKFKSVDDFARMKDDVPNARGQHLAIKKVGSKDVEFEGGAKATVDPKFVDGTKKQSLAVWELTGSLPITEDMPAKYKYKDDMSAKEGKFEGGNDVKSLNFRRTIKTVVEAQTQLWFTSGCNGVCPHFKMVHSIVSATLSSGDKQAVDIVLSLCGFDFFDFYLLVCLEGLIPDSILEVAYRTLDLVDPVATRIQFFKSLAEHKEQKEAIFSQRAKLRAVVDSTRDNINSIIDPVKRLTAIIESYKTLESTNKIGELEIFPSIVADYFKRRPGLRIVIDELRYITHCRVAQMFRGFDAQEYQSTLNIIKDTLESIHRGEGKHLLSVQMLNTMMAPNELFNEILVFLSSDCFMFYPKSPEECSQIRRSVYHHPGKKLVYYNIQKATFNAVDHMCAKSGRGDEHDAVRKFIQELPADKLSEDKKQELLGLL